LWDKEEIQFRGFIFIFKFTSWLVLGIILCWTIGIWCFYPTYWKVCLLFDLLSGYARQWVSSQAGMQGSPHAPPGGDSRHPVSKQGGLYGDHICRFSICFWQFARSHIGCSEWARSECETVCVVLWRANSIVVSCLRAVGASMEH
jgi:hypothetical protein